MRKEKIARSNGFPSSRACSPPANPSHCEGRRDPIMNIQIKGTQSANEVPELLAGSKRKSAKSRISHRISANVGGMLSIHLRLAESEVVETMPAEGEMDLKSAEKLRDASRLFLEFHR
jgi:hypothetical protein